MKKENQHYDIVIVGAGLVGLIMALSLASKKIKVTIIERNNLSREQTKKIDKRTTALSQGTKRYLKSLNLWDEIKLLVQPIKKIEVSDNSMIKNLLFDSTDLNEGDLGFIIENELFKKILINKVIKSTFIKLLDKENVVDIKFEKLYSKNKVRISLDSRVITSSLIIGADGRYSRIKHYANIKSFSHTYKQNAYVFILEHKKNHQGVAVERFFPEGPLAILPMKKKNKNISRSSIVWTIDEKLGDFSKLSNEDFKTEFAMRYKNYFGSIVSISRPLMYPLNLSFAYENYKNCLVLVGDSSQAIHPIAGQGFNLGVRDCFNLSEALDSSIKLGIELGDKNTLSDYSNKRSLDKTIFIGSTHILNYLFSNNNSFVKFFRTTGLGILEKLPKMKKQLMYLAMGLRKLNLNG